MDLKKIYLSIYSFGYSAGFLSSRAGASRQTMTLDHFLDLTQTLGLGGVEIPIDRYFPNLAPTEIRPFYDKLNQMGLGLTCDLEEFSLAKAKEMARALADIGQSFFRVKMSNIYGGARYLDQSFSAKYRRFIQDLEALVPVLQETNTRILIENHQDLAAEELLEIIETVGASHIGVNWDIGSSLALTETPISFLKKVSRYVGNVHLKDYQLYSNPRGIKLVRCALGSGVVDFKECLSYLHESVGDVPMSIELGAWIARQADVYVPDYWSGFRPAQASERADFFGYISRHCVKESGDNWKTAWEKGLSGDKITQIELEELRSTLDFLATLP